jgi:uncharacterized membrane protein
MSELVSIAFETPEKAFEARAAFLRLQRNYVVTMDDVVVVTRDEKGKVKLHQAVNLPLHGGVGGAFWGTLIGLLFLNPLLGMALGAGAGALSGAFADIGIDDDFMQRLGQTLTPGSAALFVLLNRSTFDKILDELNAFDGTLLHTSLSKASEDELRDVIEKHELHTKVHKLH